MTDYSPYRCTHPDCHEHLSATDGGLVCPHSHFFPYAPATRIPIFASEPEGVNEYAQTNAAEIHDNALRWVFSTFESDEATLRDRLIARLSLRPGIRVLVTGAGAGNDLPDLVRAMDGKGEIFAQDIAKEMLLAGAARHEAALSGGGIKMYFSVSDATNLPFDNDFFDAAYHFGGINLFPDIAKGISEMNRVVKPGGIVVIGDEGLAPWLVNTELGRMLINNNRLYGFNPPLSCIPETARAVELSWELSNCFYVIKFEVADSPLPINIDIPHIGKRGGSIRTRYYGQLEGVTPALRDQIYAEAESRGESRVEFIESALRAALRQKAER